MTGLGQRKVRRLRTRGAGLKAVLLQADIANVFDPQTKKHYKLKIDTVVSNPANPNYVRRNIMTRGTIVKTEKGNARITSRPGQEGTINAVLIGREV